MQTSITPPQFSLTQIVALVLLVGLATEQLLHLIENGANWRHSHTKEPEDKEAKFTSCKAFWLNVASLVVAFLLTYNTNIRLMSYLPEGFHQSELLDFIITWLVLAAGAQASDSLIKYAGYLKEATRVRMERIGFVRQMTEEAKSDNVHRVK